MYNVYITPYAEFPVGAGAKIETIAQVGILDLSGSQSINFTLTVGGKKTF